MTVATQECIIRLDAAEMLQAAQVGAMRRIESLKKGFKPASGCDTSAPWQIDIEGAMAECAVAKALGVYWSRGAWGKADIGRNVQVRHTKLQQGRLIVRPDDEGDEPFALAIGGDGVYRIAGWLYGRECKQPEWLMTTKGREDSPAYFAPQDALRPIESLREVMMRVSIQRHLDCSSLCHKDEPCSISASGKCAAEYKAVVA